MIINRPIFTGYIFQFVVSEKYQKRNDQFETHYVLNRSFQVFPINYHDTAPNSLHSVQRIQNARNNLVKLFFTTISSKRFLATEFIAFKNMFSLGIFTPLYIYSRILKSYFIRYYFSYNHIKALSIISSYISKKRCKCGVYSLYSSLKPLIRAGFKIFLLYCRGIQIGFFSFCIHLFKLVKKTPPRRKSRWC